METAPGPHSPRYVEISREILRRIEAGDYPVGDELPTESELQEEFGVSRFTIREALRILAGWGIVARRQGSGSRVLSKSRPSKFTFTAPLFSEVLRYMAPSTIQFKRQDRPLPKATCELLELTDTESWTWFTGVRALTNGQKIALSYMIVRTEYAPVVDTGIFGPGATVFERISEKYGVTIADVRQTVEATVIGPAEARRLSTEPNSPGLRVVRQFSEAHRVFEYTVAVHPIDRFKFVITLRPDGAD